MRRTRDTIIIIMVMWKPHVIFLLNCDLQITIVYLVNCQHLILTKLFDDGFREWFFRQRSEKGVTCKMLFLFFHINSFFDSSVSINSFQNVLKIIIITRKKIRCNPIIIGGLFYVRGYRIKTTTLILTPFFDIQFFWFDLIWFQFVSLFIVKE